ncbi:MAG: 30S ribosomal protein S8 [Alphaproteobacteria bacterium]|nr:30S ribosomal protein S8 [Alphaproteobacteria bacterium]
MSFSDPVGDMLTRIRNGQSANKSTIASPASKMRENVLNVLQQEGYIRGYSRVNIREGVEELNIELKYSDGEPVISEIKRVSKPGQRVYSSVKELPKVYNGLGISILSTPRGVMSDNDAKKANVGGEVLCKIF